MKLTSIEREQLGVAAHEASHAVMTILHNGRVDYAEVRRCGTNAKPGATDGVCWHFPPTLDTIASRRDIIAAGTLGQAIWLHGGRPTPRQLGILLERNGDDHGKLQLMSFTHRESTDSMLAAGMPLVRQCWPAVARLATALHFEGKIGHADVLAALGIPSAEDAPNYVSAIRSGSIHVPSAVT